MNDFTVRPENGGFRVFDPEGRPRGWFDREADARASAARATAARAARAAAPPPPPDYQQQIDDALDAAWPARVPPAPPQPPPPPHPGRTPAGGGYVIRPANVGYQVLD